MALHRPSASLCALQTRATLLRAIRDYFLGEHVLEVTTPVLGAATVTDPHLASLYTQAHARTHGQRYYLQTSPEYYMKRLLAAGSGDIYQIGPVFRDEETGARHQIEFTMLEWYRLAYDHHQLMNDVTRLLQACAGISHVDKLSYRDVFLKYADVDPFSCSIEDLLAVLTREKIHLASPDTMTFQDGLDAIMSMVIEPQLGQANPIFIFDYPKEQAALARVNSDERTAARFELYYRGLELCNGFYELLDADEQAKRFENDNARRREMGLPSIDIDTQLLAALRDGMPACSGVALGLDRLLMAMMNTRNIADVVSFVL